MLKVNDVLYYFSVNSNGIEEIEVVDILEKDYAGIVHICYKPINKKCAYTYRVIITNIKDLNNIDMAVEGYTANSDQCIISTNKNELINGIVKHNKKEIKLLKEAIKTKEKEIEKFTAQIQ